MNWKSIVYIEFYLSLGQWDRIVDGEMINKIFWQEKYFPELCESSQQITEPEEGAVEPLEFIAGWLEVPVTSWDLWLAFEMWAVFQDWAFNLWVLMLMPGGSCQNWIERQDRQVLSESWRSNTLEKITTHLVSEVLRGKTIHSWQCGTFSSNKYWGQSTRNWAVSPVLCFWKHLILALRYQAAATPTSGPLHETEAIPPSTLANVLFSTLAIHGRGRKENLRK